MSADATAGSRAVLFGVHAYQHLGELDGVRHNVPALSKLLTAAEVGGLAGAHCVEVPADSTPGILLDALQDAADDARDLLLVYYAGHGHFGRDGRSLHLATTASHVQRPHHSVAYDEIRAIVARSKARHRIVIVDSCFSGLALPMDGAQTQATAAADFEIEGACVLTSAAETQRSLCLPEGSVFTLELAALLRDGLSDGLPDGRRGEDQPVLTMADVFEVLRSRLKGRTVDGHPVPLPRMSTRDNGHRIPLARNRAFTGDRTGTRAPRTPHTAYAPTRHFTGRDQEIAELQRMAAQPPAVCLVHGRGGQGKSQLLRAAAAGIAHLFPGGCLEVDLRGWTPDEKPRNPYAVIAEQLHHMGHSPEHIPADLTARAETWRRVLEERPVLLLLDNARDTGQLLPLLPGANSPSMVMISSRSELAGLSTDWRHALAPLSATECATVWHKMGVPEDTRRLGELADRIDGSPLVLGPLSTRLLRGASPEAVLASLAGPDRYRAAFREIDAAERAAFTSAYEALDDDLRTLIRHCAWHPGPDFGPDSLAAMAELPEHEAEVRLTEIEQLLIGTNGRYSFHDLSLSYTRQTAARDATKGEEEASRERLYDHLHTGLKSAREVMNNDPDSDDQAVAKARLWLNQHAQELTAAARAASANHWSRAADFLIDLGLSLYLEDRYTEAEELLQLVMSSTAPQSLGQANTTKRRGDIRRMQGQYDEAAAAYQEAHTLYQTLGNRLGQANTTQGQGNIHYTQGRYDEATAAYQEAHTLYETLGDRRGQANTTESLGDIHYAQGRYDEAAAAYQEAHTIYQTLGARLGQANTTQDLGDVHRMQGRYDEATAAYQEAHTLFQTLGDRRGQANTTKGLGDIHYARGRYNEATAAYQEAHSRFQTLGDRLGQANTTKSVGDLHRMQGRYDEAAAAYQEAHTIYRTLGDRLGQAGALLATARNDRARSRRRAAARGFAAARDVYADIGIAKWAEIAQKELDNIEGDTGQLAGDQAQP
ncbi:caspase, EACC1-associated type [Streptomyces sp. CA-135486]|uniref:caspase, EACC1-associated type n=1 Tax=Streptomyces sp. CA-135486 TaxID=3240049 RepID=UPI003D942F9F